MAAQGTLYGACELSSLDLPEAMDEKTYAEILTFVKSHPLEVEDHPDSAHSKRGSYAWRTFRWFMRQVQGALFLTCPSEGLRGVRAVLQELGDEGTGEHYSDAELKLRRDMAAAKVVWYADYWKDLWCFTRNTNPILALYYSHHLHPISRNERIFITLVTSLFVMMISSAIPRSRSCMAEGLSCPHDLTSLRTQEEEFCCMAEHIGLIWSLKNLSLGFDLGGTIYATVANFVFAQILYQCGASCACFQNSKNSLRRCCELLGHVLMFLIFLAMLVPTRRFTEYNVQHGTVGDVLLTFITSKPLSMLLTSVVQTALFTALWHLRITDDYSTSKQQYYVTAEDYWAFAKSKLPGPGC